MSKLADALKSFSALGLTNAQILSVAVQEALAVAARVVAETNAGYAASSAAAAQASGKIFTSTALGIAATTSGQGFLVTTTDPQVYTLYTNVSGVATLFGTFSVLSKSFFDGIFDTTGYMQSGWIDAVVDGSTPKKVLYGIDENFILQVFVDAVFSGSATFANLIASGATYGGQALSFESGYSQSGYQYALLGGSSKALLSIADDGTLESLPRPTYIDSANYAIYDAPDSSNVRQIYTEHKTTGVINKISSGAGNNFSPRLTADGLSITWTTDRDNAPIRNMLWSLIAAPSEHPVFSYADVACWGDSLTQGTGATSTNDYPTRLGVLLPSRNVSNNGIASQRSTDIAARQGAVAINITFPSNTIPASATATVTCDSNPLQFASTQKLAGVVSGVYGQLTISGSTYTWTRKTAGSAVVLSGAALFTPDTGLKNQGVTVLWVGRNNIAVSPSTVLSDIAAMVANLTALNKRFIVMGILNAADEPTGSATYIAITTTNATLSSTYGNKYIDMRQILVDAYNPAIPADVTAFASNCVPPSLQSDNIHLNNAGYLLVAQTVANKITALGW